MNFKANKKLGQNFLINRDIAISEAAHAEDKTVLEIGPGRGMLTEELCNVATHVIAIEKDERLFNYLTSKLQYKNLTLLNKDFFSCTNSELMLDKVDILISNIPYNLSSKVISWLHHNNIEAILCLQKEFVEHMLATSGSKNYSKLSVICALSFKIIEIMKVSKKSFIPKPKIDSQIIYLKPLASSITEAEDNMINFIMQHKKKLLKNAVLDSSKNLNISHEKLILFLNKTPLSSERVFMLSPAQILQVARELSKLQK